MPIPLTFTIIEISIYVFFIVVLVLVYQDRANRRAEYFTLLAIIIFSYIGDYSFTHFCELMAPVKPCESLSACMMINQYTNGEFLVMLPGNEPLWIMLGWAVLFFIAIKTARLLNAPFYLRPVLSALLVANIDWAMEPVAVNFGWWVWKDNPATNVFFNSPYSNFLAWYILVFSYSFMVQMGFKWFNPATEGKKILRDMLVPLLAIIPALFAVLLIVFGFFHAALYCTVGQTIAMVLVFGISIFFVFAYAWDFRKDNAFDWKAGLLLAIPAYFYALYFILLIATGLYEKEGCYPILAVYLPAISSVGMICYMWPFLESIFRFFRKFRPGGGR